MMTLKIGPKPIPKHLNDAADARRAYPINLLYTDISNNNYIEGNSANCCIANSNLTEKLNLAEVK